MATQYGMVIDTKRCIACYTCSMACKIENNLTNDMWWNQVINVGGEERDAPAGVYPNLTMSTFTFACQHCENPACVAVCPTGTTYKREEDGVVMQETDKCIGCKLCMEACPYEGVRTYLEGEPAYHIDFPVGGPDAPEHYENTVEKCTFCSGRVARGEEPACIEVCPGRARVFGDLNDPNSEISQLIASRTHHQLLPEAGTNPCVYLLD